MLAVFVNCGTILLGSIIGLLFARKISEKITDSIQMACGVVSFTMGIQMAFKHQNVVYLALALILGGILGTALDIDGKILKFGGWLGKFTGQSKQDAEGGKKNFAYAFLNASVLFCVGAMAIVGSFKAGIDHDYSTIFLKSVLDGFVSIGFAAAMGAGTAFSIIAIFIYQGALTLLSVWVKPYVSDQMVAEITGSGGAMIIFIGLNLMGLKKVKTANYLPAILFSVIFVLLEPKVMDLIGWQKENKPTLEQRIEKLEQLENSRENSSEQPHELLNSTTN